MYWYLKILILLLSIYSCNQGKPETTYKLENDTLKIVGEKHLRNIKMLTDEGENAEAYFSFGEDRLIFQSTHGAYPCDQIFTMNLSGENKKIVSTGKGRTTCSYFLPDDKKIIYASTHRAFADCPPKPDYSQGYVWKVYKAFDLYIANADGSDPTAFLSADGYDAEATISPKGDRIVFTSMRSGD
ncbi:MAG TPA: hypothetical protein ENO27_01295, partial [Caldithrix sp.]|nr:hypothetical protein [Caldithrix sp.]